MAIGVGKTEDSVGRRSKWGQDNIQSSLPGMSLHFCFVTFGYSVKTTWVYTLRSKHNNFITLWHGFITEFIYEGCDDGA
jgi:hypothetical protein